jgi:type I restriction enzyme S subunit
MSFPRYATYKDSGVEWLGKVPGHWQAVRFSRLISAIKDGTHGTFARVSDGFPLLSAKNVLDGRLEIGDTESLISEADHQEITSNGFPRKGDLLLTIVGTLGRCCVFEQDEPIAFQRSVCFIRMREEHFPQFIYFVSQSQFFQEQLIGRSKSAAQAGVYMGDVAGMTVLLPPRKAEQQAIASFLNRETAKIDALVAEQEQLITLLKEKRQAVISHAVTKGLDASVPSKASGVEWLGEVPAHWGVSPLKFLARIGNGSTPNRDNPNYWAEDGFPWLNSSVVNQSEVSEAERFVTETALKECHLPIIEPPAVLVGITGQGKTRGMAAPLAFTATVNQHLAYIKPDQDRLHVGFLLCALEAAYEHLRTESEGVGSTKGAITCGQLGAWCLPAPALDVQAEIVSFLGYELNKLDELTAQAETAIGLLTERRSALISAAVTGQIDVRHLAPQEAA